MIFAGFLIALLGIWGGIVPFIGPVFHFGVGTAGAWEMTTSRLFLHVVPGAAALLGGLILWGRRAGSLGLGGLLALCSGAWFILGPVLWPLVQGSTIGPLSSGPTLVDVLKPLTYNFGTGVVVAALGAFVLGRLSGLSGARRVEVPRVSEPRTERAPVRESA
jgi:hypothetical protein